MESSLGSDITALLSPESRVALGRDAASLGAQVHALTARILAHEEQIERLRQQRDVVQNAIDKIHALTASASDAISPTPTLTSAAEPPSSAGLTLADEIEAVIRAAKAPLHYKEILCRLQAGGVNVGGKEPAATLLSILANKRYEARFARSDRGIYTLAGATEVRVSTRPSKRRRRPARARRVLERSA